jgi:hypothetical protein
MGWRKLIISNKTVILAVTAVKTSNPEGDFTYEL